MKSNVVYRKNDDCYFKINHKLKRITKIEKNEVSYLDYKTNISKIINLKSIRLNVWKRMENSFFISRHFQWEYNGAKYTTTDKQIDWFNTEHAVQARVAAIFHNGKIWKATFQSGYYPRIYLERIVYDTPTRTTLVEKENYIKEEERHFVAKWTDIKYCRHFEKTT